MPLTRTPLGRRRAPPARKTKRAPGTHCQNCQNTSRPAPAFDGAPTIDGEQRVKELEKAIHRCPEGLILGSMKRTIDDLPLVRVATLRGAWRDWAGSEDGAHPVRRRRGRVPGRRQAAALHERRLLGDVRLPAVRRAARSGFVCSMASLPVASASGRAG